MNNRTLKFFLSAVTLVASVTATLAQRSNYQVVNTGSITTGKISEILFFGKILDSTTKKPIPNSRVLIKDLKGNVLQTLKTGSDGRFQFETNYDVVRVFEYVGDGYVSKNILFDSRDVPKPKPLGGQGFDFEMLLFKRKEGCDYSLLEEPIGLATYNPETGMIGFDTDYTKGMIPQIKALEEGCK